MLGAVDDDGSTCLANSHDASLPAGEGLLICRGVLIAMARPIRSDGHASGSFANREVLKILYTRTVIGSADLIVMGRCGALRATFRQLLLPSVDELWSSLGVGRGHLLAISCSCCVVVLRSCGAQAFLSGEERIVIVRSLQRGGRVRLQLGHLHFGGL